MTSPSPLWWCWVALASSELLLIPRPLLAQDRPPADDRAAPESPVPEAPDVEQKKEEAKEHFFRGVEHVQNEDWDAALAEFLESRDLYPSIAATKNVAVALRQLKRYAESLEMYEELVREFGASLRQDEKTTAQEAMAKLRQSVGQISIEGAQAGSTVIIDGQEHGTTPLAKPINVNAGTHSIRVYKEGYVPFEAQILVAGQQRKRIEAKLKALTRSGKLRVTETSGKKLDVVVDGAVVGQTPWEGTLAVGTHTVFLRGEGDVGTPPSAATVFANQSSSLALIAGVLDAALRIEPTPSNARVDIDGVQVGNGVWEGRLESGAHKIEVTAKGFLAYRRDVSVRSGQRQVATVSLQRDLTDPMWKEAVFVPHIYVEAVGGPGIAPSFGGAADNACSRGECSRRSRPFGFTAGARGGYQLTSGLGLELFLGYVRMEESMTRDVTASSDVDLRARDYEDTTSFSGALAAASASYQFLERTPLLFRVWAGAARVRARYSNWGTYSGTYVNTSVSPNEVFAFSEEQSFPEKSANLWLPLLGPEVRFGYRFGESLAVDVGVAGFLVFAPDAPRSDAAEGGDRRKGALSDYQGVFSDGSAARPGLAKLDKEAGFGTSLAVFPTLGMRLDL